MSSSSDAGISALAAVAKGFAAPARMELLRLLAQGPRTVVALASELGFEVANASQHLQGLLAAGLVQTTRRGAFVEYQLASPVVAAALTALQDCAAAHHPGYQQHVHAIERTTGKFAALYVAKLLQQVKRRTVVLIDARPAQEFAMGHLPGAHSLPAPLRNLKRLPFAKAKPIVVYGRDAGCAVAAAATVWLQKKRYRAQMLGGGVIEWRALGGALVRAVTEAAGTRDARVKKRRRTAPVSTRVPVAGARVVPAAKSSVATKRLRPSRGRAQKKSVRSTIAKR